MSQRKREQQVTAIYTRTSQHRSPFEVKDGVLRSRVTGREAESTANPDRALRNWTPDTNIKGNHRCHLYKEERSDDNGFW